MPLNGVERMQQKEFEREQYARPTKEQLEIASLEEELQHAENEISYLEDYIEKSTKQRKKRITYSENDIDKMFEQRAQIIEAIRKVVTDAEFSDGLFTDEVLRIVGWRR